MKRLLLIPILALSTLSMAGAQEKKAPEVFGRIDRRDPAFDELIPKDAKLEKLADGFKWSEGPVWVKDKGHLLFSDIPNNAIHKWDPKAGLTRDFIKPAGYTGEKSRGGEPGSNGLALDSQGRLVLCEHGDRRVTRIEKDGKKTVLADKYMGKRFNSPNDLVYDSQGNLYFTDPPYGLEKNYDDPARELDWCGVYRLGTDGKVVLLTKEMSRPNGIGLSVDEKTLYVANSDPQKAIWKTFQIQPDGSLSGGKVFYDVTPWLLLKKGLPDGLKIDVKGNVFATGPAGVLVFNPEGKLLGVIETGVPTANCAFAEDGSTLYITANDSLARIRTSTKGREWK